MFSFGDCARCVVDILDGLGIDQAHFVGNSWGGMIGATFAATYPERIGRAVLMNCTAGRAGVRQKFSSQCCCGWRKWHGGIGPLLTRPVLKAFLGPTTFRERPDVVAQVRSAVSVNIASASWAVKSVVPARPDQRAFWPASRHRCSWSRALKTPRSHHGKRSRWLMPSPTRRSGCSTGWLTLPGWKTPLWSASRRGVLTEGERDSQSSSDAL